MSQPTLKIVRVTDSRADLQDKGCAEIAAWHPDPPDPVQRNWSAWIGVTLAVMVLSAVCGLAALARWAT